MRRRTVSASIPATRLSCASRPHHAVDLAVDHLDVVIEIGHLAPRLVDCDLDGCELAVVEQISVGPQGIQVALTGDRTHLLVENLRGEIPVVLLGGLKRDCRLGLEQVQKNLIG